jgi:secreted PhoX family phosphatase
MIGDVILRRYSRREMMRGTLGVAAIAALFGPQVLAASKARAEASPDRFRFEEVEAGVDVDHHVADGYKARPLIRWGDKLFPDSLPFDPLAQTAAAQLRQFGYNNDYIAYFPIDGSSRHGLLCVNHEYTNEELMFPALKERQDTTGFKDMTEELVDIEMAAHGVTVVEVARDGEDWRVVLDSPYNRRISPLTNQRRSFRQKPRRHAQQLRWRGDAVEHLPHRGRELPLLLLDRPARRRRQACRGRGRRSG